MSLADDGTLAYSNLDYFSQHCFNEQYPNEDFHRHWYDIAQDEDVRRAVNIAPRNSGKTTCWAKKAPLWLLGRDPNLKILLLSRTGSKARSNLRFIRTNIESNPCIKKVFPKLEQDQPWSDEEITVKNTRMDGESSALARGLGGSITGLRADVLIVDDLIDKTNVMTETQRAKVHEYWDEQVMPTLNPNGRIFLIGTRYHHRDFYARMLEEPTYRNNVYMFPAFKTDFEGRVILEKGEPISYWPTRWPTERLLERKQEITYRQGSIAWACQFMGDPSGYEGRLFKDEWLTYYDAEKDIVPKLPNMDYVMSVDPNISADPTANNTAIVTLAVDRKHKDIYVLDIFAEPMDFIGQVGKLNQYARRPQLRVGKYGIPGEQHIRKIGIESVAYQKALMSTGYLMGLPVVEVHHSKVDKVTRLLRIQPHIENGRIRFPDPEVHPDVDWWDDFYDEYITFPRGRRDDRMDALEVAVEISGILSAGSSIPWGPGSDSTRRYVW